MKHETQLIKEDQSEQFEYMKPINPPNRYNAHLHHWSCIAYSVSESEHFPTRQQIGEIGIERDR